SHNILEAQVLTDGTYNVASTGTLDFDSAITLTGSLSGTLDGTLNWRGNANVALDETASFDFTGNATIDWVSGSLVGGGTLINNSTIDVLVNDVFIQEISLLTNNSLIQFTGTGNIYIGEDSELRNSTIGLVDFQANGSGISPSGNGINLLNNQGLVKNTSGGNVTISAETENSGTIEATSGVMSISTSLNNQIGGRLSGVGTINLPSIANLTNDGNVSPGLSPGTLTLSGNYLSSSNSVLEMELNGLTPDTQHDVLAISGTNVIFEGTIDVTLGFDPTIGDTFTIATATGTITGQNLESPVNVTANGYNYSFSVSYPNDNSVVLTLDDRTLGLDEYANINAAIKVYPNPAKDVISLENSGNFQLLDAEIIDITGKIIQRIDLSSMNVIQTITLSNYASGVYYVRVNALNTTITKKIIKQ
ncbi:T9SS type A sorting domain-containing protein, partial [Meridianimaribacter flavus]